MHYHRDPQTQILAAIERAAHGRAITTSRDDEAYILSYDDGDTGITFRVSHPDDLWCIMLKIRKHDLHTHERAAQWSAAGTTQQSAARALCERLSDGLSRDSVIPANRAEMQNIVGAMVSYFLMLDANGEI